MDTRTLTLSDFLLARISEREADAVAIRECEWYQGVESDAEEQVQRLSDPAYVIADCEAKRRIVELRYSWNLQAERMSEPPFGPILQTQVNTADAVLRCLALPYADHPDYDESWRPY